MAVTILDEVRAPQSRAYIGGDLPTTPAAYYSQPTSDVQNVAWRGGEMAFNTRDNRLYIQTATSGSTATWKRYLTALTAV